MANDKPFECTEPGCGMSFANEDHLSVHQAKHAMSLALTSGSTRPGCLLTFVADQTPTPTKFLRNCEEMGLFHELSKNPFEEAFKKAAEDGKSMDMQEQSSPYPVTSLDSDTLHVESIADSLNTPTPMVLDSVMRSLANIKSSHLTVRTNNNDVKCSQYSPLPGPDAETGSTLGTTTSVVSTSPHMVQAIHVQRLSVNEAGEIIDSSSDNSVMLPVTVEDADSCGSYVTLTTNDITETSQPEMASDVYYIMINSPSGEMIPVQIPTACAPVATIPTATKPAPKLTNNRTFLAVPKTIASVPVTSAVSCLMSTSTTPTIVVLPKLEPSRAVRTTSVSAPTVSSGIATSTKERLKAAIQQNSQANIVHNNMQVMSDAVDWITSNQSRVTATTQSCSMTKLSNSPAGVVSTTASIMVRLADQLVRVEDADTSTPKHFRLSTSDDDQEDRRRKFLERNRAAAARCRVKKKSWMSNLEQRAENVDKVNSLLQSEVVKLRQEVAQLKTMLLAHSDCPVTRRQRALLAASQVDVVAGLTKTENDEAIAMAALSTLADSGVHLSNSHVLHHVIATETVNCTIAVDLSSSNSNG